jgi:hypothetical protein
LPIIYEYALCRPDRDAPDSRLLDDLGHQRLESTPLFVCVKTMPGLDVQTVDEGHYI